MRSSEELFIQFMYREEQGDASAAGVVIIGYLSLLRMTQPTTTSPTMHRMYVSGSGAGETALWKLRGGWY